jgi:hypothetical protein
MQLQLQQQRMAELQSREMAVLQQMKSVLNLSQSDYLAPRQPMVNPVGFSHLGPLSPPPPHMDIVRMRELAFRPQMNPSMASLPMASTHLIQQHHLQQQRGQQQALAMMQGNDQSSLASLLGQTSRPLGAAVAPPHVLPPPAYGTGPSGLLSSDSDTLMRRVGPPERQQQEQQEKRSQVQQPAQRSQEQEPEEASKYGTLAFQQLLVTSPEAVSVAQDLPLLLTFPGDEDRLSDYQLLLRSHVEFFRADNEDLLLHCRGRNKPIRRGQVGIRCIHCKHARPRDRTKGSMYFPFRLTGVYQAAQNMGSAHFGQVEEGDGCPFMPADIKTEFRHAWASKSNVGAGKEYWAKAAHRRGLVDTDTGIRFVQDL